MARSKRRLSRAALFSKAEAEGKAARRAGQPQESCPYKQGAYSMKYMGWQVGWNGAYDRTSDPAPDRGDTRT